MNCLGFHNWLSDCNKYHANNNVFFQHEMSTQINTIQIANNDVFLTTNINSNKYYTHEKKSNSNTYYTYILNEIVYFNNLVFRNK